MFTAVRSLGLFGVTGYEVRVECDISSGLPRFDLVGLPDNAVKEARSRTAIAVAEEMSEGYRQSLIGTVQEVLFETAEGEFFIGHAPIMSGYG